MKQFHPIQAMLVVLMFSLISCSSSQKTDPLPTEIWQAGTISLPDIDETSPSFTADGQTFVFARTTGWAQKVPFIARWENDTYRVEQLTFTDSLYNLAISPDGNRIFYQQYPAEKEEAPSATFWVDRQGDHWGEPQLIPSLAGIGAGYFCPLADGTLYFFAYQPRIGIYRAEEDGEGGYGPAEWLSDAVSPAGTVSFDVLVRPAEDRLLVTRASEDESKLADPSLNGVFYYEKTDAGWKQQHRLPLPYGWGASVINEVDFLYVLDGDLHRVSLDGLELDWAGH